MKIQLPHSVTLGVLALLFTASSFANTQKMISPTQVSLSCGVKRVSLQDFRKIYKNDVNKIDVSEQEIEGSAIMDSGEASAVKASDKEDDLNYLTSSQQLFLKGTPSYNYRIGLSIDPSSYVESNEKESAYFAKSQVTFETLNKNGTRVRKELIKNSLTVLTQIEPETGLISWISAQMDKNAHFRTAKSIYAIRCSFDFRGK